MRKKRLRMYKLLQEINPVLFGKNDQEASIEKSGRLVGEPPIDNFVFRLHYRATTAGLIAASILVIITHLTILHIIFFADKQLSLPGQ